MQIRYQETVEWSQWLTDVRAEFASAAWACADAVPKLMENVMGKQRWTRNGVCQSRLPSFGMPTTL
jgi:hypothetical protein